MTRMLRFTLSALALAVLCLSARPGGSILGGQPAAMQEAERGDVVAVTVAEGLTVKIPVPAGFTAVVGMPQDGESGRVVFNSGLGPRMILTVAPADATAEPEMMFRAGGADGVADFILDDLRRDGLHASLARQGRLDVGTEEGLYASYVSIKARRECKPYTLGGVEGIVATTAGPVAFTIRLFQGDPESDKVLASAWLREFRTLNSEY